MTMAVAAACIAILALAAAFHFYWGLGGRTGSGVSLPHREDGSVVVVKNSGAGAIVVGLALVAVALLVLALVDAFAVPMPAFMASYRRGAVGDHIHRASNQLVQICRHVQACSAHALREI